MPSPEDKMSLKVLGIIVKAPPYNKTQDRVFIVEAEDKKYEVKDNFDLYLEIGDRFYGHLRKIEKSEMYEMIKYPYVIVGIENDAIDSVFTRVIGKARAVALRNEIILYIDRNNEFRRRFNDEDPEDIISYLNRKAVEFKNNKQKTVMDYPFDIKKAHFLEILNKWSKRFWRQLRLFRVNGNQLSSISKSEDTYLDVIEQIEDNPFLVQQLTIKQCVDFLDSRDETASELQIYSATIARWIYNDMIGYNGWSHVPLKMLVTKFPLLETYRSVLEEDFEIVFDDDRVYTRKTYLSESKVAEFIKDKLEVRVKRIPAIVESFCTEEQINAINGALSHPIYIITGGPGTGKSTIIGQIAETLHYNQIPYWITSFTGMSIKRLKNIIGNPNIKIETMDYLIMRYRGYFTRKIEFEDEEREEPPKIVIFDEASMITTELFYRFITAIKTSFRIIFVGDTDQLPPIGSGALFKELLRTGKIPTHRLMHNHRVSSGKGNIIVNAQKIIETVNSTIPPNLIIGDGYFEVWGAETPLPLVKRLSTYTSTDDFKILSPYKEVYEINRFVQEIYSEKYFADLNDKVMKEIEVDGKRWIVGDLVMVMKNDYTNNLRNGEEGRIIAISREKLTVKFPGREDDVHFFFSVQKEEEEIETKSVVDSLTLSYAITVHKSQGSEYNNVILYIPKKTVPVSKSAFLNINLLYTAITRTKTSIWVVGDRETYYQSMKKIPAFRRDYLADRIGIDNPEEIGFEDFEFDFD